MSSASSRKPSFDQAAWAQEAAASILNKHSDSAAIETADYRECGLLLAAAKLVLEDRHLAGEVGALMEPPRHTDH